MTVIPGYEVHSTLTYGRGYSADEQARMWAHFSKLRANSHLFLDNLDWARECKRRFPDCIVVYRAWSASDGAFHKLISPEKFVEDHQRFSAGGIVVQCLNEPKGYEEKPGDLKRLAAWCAQVMKLAADAEMALALPSFGVGHPDEKKLSDLDEMWRAFKTYPMHFYACHEYGTYRGMTYTDDKHTHDVTPWRVGRFKIVTDYVKEHFDYDLMVLVTETGIDSSFYPDDDHSKRGWRDSGLNEVQYALELIKASKAVYNLPNVKGLNIFSHGNTGKQGTADDWKSHDVSFLADFQRELETYAATQEKPVTFPLPTDPKWTPEENQSGAAYGVRQTLISGAIAHIREREKFWRYPNSEVENWIVVKTVGGQIGYCDRGILTVAPPAPPPETDDPPIDWTTSLEAVIASLSKNITELESEVAALKLEQQTVENRLSDKNHSLVRLIDSRTILQLYLDKLAAKAA